MRRLTTIIAGVALAVLSYGLPVLADEVVSGMSTEKNECLLVAQNCGTEVDSIQERISRLQEEIAKGTDVYSADELRTLNNELMRKNNLLNYLQNDIKPTFGESI